MTAKVFLDIFSLWFTVILFYVLCNIFALCCPVVVFVGLCRLMCLCGVLCSTVLECLIPLYNTLKWVKRQQGKKTVQIIL